jgi:regulator of sigma D
MIRKNENNDAKLMKIINGDVHLHETCVGTFYFCKTIPDFVEFVHDIKSWDFSEGVDYDFTPLLFQPSDAKFFKFASKIVWDEMDVMAMYHLPFRFRFMLDGVNVQNEGLIIERLLMLSGNVESNPGPIQSRPLQYRNNDPRTARLEKALERKDQKIKKLIKDLRRAIKHNKIYAQGLFDIKESAGEMNANLTRICNFLENSLPVIQGNVQAMVLDSTEKVSTIKDDLIKVILICLIVRLMMVWKHYKTALAIVLIFVLKFYGFDETIINLVHEAKAKFMAAQGMNDTVEETIYHPYFQTCGKLIFAVIVFVCIKKIPGKNDWDNYISRLDRIPKALQGSQKIVDYCSEYFNLANDQIKMMVLGKTKEELARANGVYTEIHEWAAEVRKYLDLEQRNKIDTDITIANKVEELYKRGVKFQQDTLLDREMARLVSVTLLPARELYQYVSCSPVKGGGPRMRPICVWLIGESGVGKTEMVYPLCIDVLRTMGLMNKQDFHHQVYGRQVETEFWDGYKGQKIVIYDDAFQKKDDKTSPNPEIFEVIRSCNTFPQHLHMAALHDKNTFSAAELMLYTTNDNNVKLESITFPDAFYNRIGEHAYIVRPKLRYATTVQKDKSNVYYRKLNKAKLNKETPIDLDVYEFQKIVRDAEAKSGWTEVGHPMGYHKFAKFICDEWKEKKQQSLDKLKFLEQYAIRAQVGPENKSGEEQFYDLHDSEWFVNDIARRMQEGEDLINIESEYAIDEELFGEYLRFKNQRKHSIWDKYIVRIDDCLMRTGNMLKKWKEESVRIIKEHPYLSLLGFVGMALSAFAMYKWFETSMLEATAEVGVSGDDKTNKQTGRYVEVGTSGDDKTSKTQQKRVEVGVSGDPKTPKTSKKTVEGLDKDLLDTIKAQGCQDMAAHQLITDVLQKSTYRLSYMKGGVRRPFGNCTFVRGWVFLMPYHFLHALYARKLAPETEICFSQAHNQDIIRMKLSHVMNFGTEGFTLTKNCVQLKHKNGEMRDCVLVNLHSQACHLHRDLIKHFVKVEDQGKLVGQFSGTFATFHESGGDLFRVYQWLTKIRALDAPITIYMTNEAGSTEAESSYVQRDCYEYNAPTQVGDCGSLVGLYNHRIERKLIGLHIAGTNESYGYACPLTQEAIIEGCKKLLGSDFRNISAQFYYEIPKNVDSTAEIEVPEGLFCPLGKSAQKVGQATKTTIVPSCIQGKLSKPMMRPAILRPTTINGELHDPLMKGLRKCGVETAVLNDFEIESAVQDVAQVVLTQYDSMLCRETFQRILSYEEAVAGVQNDPMMNGVARQTSPGFPYNQNAKGFPGKTKWMGRDEKYDFESVEAKQLRVDVENLIENCRKGIISDVIFIDTLKDERRDNEKVDAGKTRVFSAGPQHFVVAFRKYFLPFSAWLMHNRIDNEIAVGTNPYSIDWERIAKRMKSRGKHVIAGDFGNFDGSLSAQVLWAIFWNIFVEWLEQFNDFSTEEGKDVLKICLGLWTHLVHSVHIFKDSVYMWTHSQPSGNPFTVIINCLYNSSIMRIAWIRIMKEKNPKWVSMKCFRKYVAMIAYGDDNELNIADEAVELFNQETISAIMKEMKHEYTDETKSGNIVKTRQLEDTFFLKRGFKFCPELQRTVAPLKIEVIYEMLNWTRNTIDPNVILMNNIETAFREIVYHGREEYDKLKTGIKKCAKHLPSIPQILTYEQYLHDVKYLADEIYEF